MSIKEFYGVVVCTRTLPCTRVELGQTAVVETDIDRTEGFLCVMSITCICNFSWKPTACLIA